MEFDFGWGPVRAHRHLNPDGSEGGWVADTATVAQTAHVFGNAQVSGNAQVFGNAQVSGNARVTDDGDLVLVGPVGSEDRTVTLFRTVDDHLVVAGCWSGTVDELRSRVAAPGTWLDLERAPLWRAQYEALCDLFDVWTARWADTYKGVPK